MIRAALDPLHDVLEVLGIQRRLVEDLHLVVPRPVDGIYVGVGEHDVVLQRFEVVRVADDLAVLRIADEDEVEPGRERVLRLAMDVVDELAGGVEDGQAARLRRVMERRRDAVRGEDDGRLADGCDLVDRADAESFHLLHDPLVVHDLSEDRAAAATRCEALHLQVGDANAGAEAILFGPFDSHRGGQRAGACEHSSGQRAEGLPLKNTAQPPSS